MNSSTRNWLIIGLIGCGILCLCIMVSIAAGLLIFNISASTTSQMPPPQMVTEEDATVPVRPSPTRTEEPAATRMPAATKTPATQVPSATATPAAPTTEPTLAGVAVVFEGVEFRYDPSLFDSVKGEIIPAQEGGDLAPWELAPRHIRFEFTGYPREGETLHHAEILVFPAAEYAQIQESAGPVIEDLKRALADQPAEFDPGAPFLPTFNAAQVMYAQVKYFDGKGMRYLTQFGQDISPIYNERVFYTYQGLAGDGLYYVSAIFPVSSPVLPDTGDVDDYDAFVNRYGEYLKETRARLEAEPAENFTPDLNLLDALVESIIVE